MPRKSKKRYVKATHGLKCLTVPGMAMDALACLRLVTDSVAGFKVKVVQALYAGVKTLVVLRSEGGGRMALVHSPREF